MLSRLHGLCSWGRGKLWPEPSLTSLQEPSPPKPKREDRELKLEYEAKRKKRRSHKIEITDGVIEAGLGSPNF
jgi:hypothetical protein